MILVPGTGTFGGEAFEYNFAKLLTASNFTDPAWLNVPGRMCDGSVKSAEHVAYAINYISTACNQNIAVIAWSQGNLSIQWALKYWPSTRVQVNNFICLCADFHGTVSSWMITSTGIDGPLLYINRRGYQILLLLCCLMVATRLLPTTSIYSRTDIIVQPHFGRWASARKCNILGSNASNLGCFMLFHELRQCF